MSSKLSAAHLYPPMNQTASQLPHSESSTLVLPMQYPLDVSNRDLTLEFAIHRPILIDQTFVDSKHTLTLRGLCHGKRVYHNLMTFRFTGKSLIKTIQE